VAAGNYTVVITDASGCTANAAGNITEPVTALSGSNISQTDVTVWGGNDGSVTVAGSDGTPGYLYKLGAGAYQVSGTFSSLTAGNYTVTVQDANLCTFDVPVTITQPLNPLTGSVTQVNVLCNGGNTGSVTVTGIDGLPPYEYSIDAVNYQTSGTFNTLTAGSYTFTVRDALLSTFGVPVTITEPALLTVSTIQTDVLCSGGSTGSATATAAGGTGLYTYSWNTTPVQATSTASGLAAGTYIVTVTDANLCTANTSVIITQPSLLSVSTTQVDVSCNGDSDGSATAVPSGGTGPYTYSWSTSPAQTSANANGLIIGTYTVTLTDANGCTATANVTIIEPDILVLEAIPTPAGCPNSDDGSIDLIITGGTAPYSPNWFDGGITTEDRLALLPGTYSVVVTDANGCNAGTSADVDYTGSFACLRIPDIITPEQVDGHNDEWIIENIDIYPNAELLIYSRWGKLIYKTKNVSANPWNGKYSNGKFVPTDSYHYILYLGDGSEPRSGVISVIR
jgi:gliding motility-associated-like protein